LRRDARGTPLALDHTEMAQVNRSRVSVTIDATLVDLAQDDVTACWRYDEHHAALPRGRRRT